MNHLFNEEQFSAGFLPAWFEARRRHALEQAERLPEPSRRIQKTALHFDHTCRSACHRLPGPGRIHNTRTKERTYEKRRQPDTDFSLFICHFLLLHNYFNRAL